jgi:hypothetical protein
LLLDIDAFAIPPQQRADSESVPEVVHARSRMIARTPQTDLINVAHSIASFVVMVLALHLSMKETKSASRRV